MTVAPSPPFDFAKGSPSPFAPSNSSSTLYRSRKSTTKGLRQPPGGPSRHLSVPDRVSNLTASGRPEREPQEETTFSFALEPADSIPTLIRSLDRSSLSTHLPVSRERRAEVAQRKIVGIRKRKRRVTALHDLPDELLLRIFSHLPEQHGFRPPMIAPQIGPAWSFPPLRLALVCRRWLAIARQLFYRTIKIHHLERISALHETFTTTNLSSLVRHLSVRLPYAAFGKLATPSAVPAIPLGREPDSDSDASSCRRSEHKKKPRNQLCAQDQLRMVFQSCSHLLSLEIMGVDPLVLFSSSSTNSASLHHLHQLRLSTIATLMLGNTPSQALTSTTLRQALLALTGLHSLSLKGYVSDISHPLEFAPTLTSEGSPARPLPLRARKLLKLRSIAIIESSMSTIDLETLLKQVQKASIEVLIVNDFYNSKEARQRVQSGLYGGLTIEGLSDPTISSLLAPYLKVLRVTLHNHPVASDVSTAGRSIPTPVSTQQIHGVSRPPDPPHILDRFISKLQAIEVLDVGGSLVTSQLLSNHTSTPERCLLPRTVRHLTIRACPTLTPAVVLDFLQQLGNSRFSGSASLSNPGTTGDHHSRDVTPSQLSILEVFGGSESGWRRDPVQSFEIQRACWATNVQWRSGGKWRPDSSTRGGEWRMGATIEHDTW